MNIKVLTPESVIFEGEVDSVLLPSKNGEFHIMKNHAAVVSSLEGGSIKLFTDEIDEVYKKHFTKIDGKEVMYAYQLNSGVVEFNNNKGIILCE